MSTILTLEGYAPPPRADNAPFTKARVEEGSAPTGPWTIIDTLTLAPLDTDAEHPKSRDLTTTKVTLEAGWYRVTWQDAAGHTSPATEPIENLSELSGGVRPTVTDVASLLRARTKIKGGAEAGAFNANTRPTADQVDELISEAMDEVLGKVKFPEDGTEYERRVRAAIRLYTAILIELSYFPEQVKSDRSPVAIFQKLYESRISALVVEAQEGEVSGGGIPGAEKPPAQAAWTFPANVGGMVGMNSRW